MSKLSVNTLLIFLILFFACKNPFKESNPDTPEETTKPVEEIIEDKAPAVIEIYVWVDKLRLRSESNTSSETVATLKEGQALTFMNERSDFTEKINLRGTLFDEP